MHSILHSFQWEPDFLEPFQALHRAIELRGQVIQKSWKDSVTFVASSSIADVDQNKGIMKRFSRFSKDTAKTVTFDGIVEIDVVYEWQCKEVLFQALPELRTETQISISEAISPRNRYPLSDKAVLIRPEGLSAPIMQNVSSDEDFAEASKGSDDLAFFIQKTLSTHMQCKNSPHDVQRELMLQGFAQGHVGEHTDSPDGGRNPSTPADDNQSSGDGGSSSYVHAPQNSEDRQEVVLYHLMHPPFQVFLL